MFKNYFWPTDVYSSRAEGDTQTDSETLDLVRGLKAQLSDEMKAVDTRSGVVVALAAALAVASYAGAEPVWRSVAIFFAFATAIAGVVALLVNTLDGAEPGSRKVLDRAHGLNSQSTLVIETQWVEQVGVNLTIRKRWLLAAYTFLVAMVVSLAISYLMANLIIVFARR